MPKPWRILVLSKYGCLGASSRLRLFQYIPHLERAGAEIVIAPLFNDSYLARLYSTGTRQALEVISAYVRRFRQVLTAKSFSTVWAQKELFPYLPSTFERLLKMSEVPYVLDLDDAIFHTYDQHRWPLVRLLLARKLDSLLTNAHSVVVGNSYLESYVRSRGAKNLVRVPTVVDTERYRFSEPPKTDEFRIGWIGSPETTKYLYMIRDALISLTKRRAIRLVTIGASPLRDFGIPLEQHAWDEATESFHLQTIHVGVMPLPNNAWERGKCGYKLVQYMASGRAVVASPVGVNQDLVTNRVGFLASQSEDWESALNTLAKDYLLCRSYGRAGRELVECSYSLHSTAPRIVQLLRDSAR